MKNFFRVLVVATGMFAGQVNALWAVIDPANLVQNITSALQSVKQVTEAIQQTRQQIAMAQKMKDDIRGLNVQGLLQAADPETTRAIQRLSGAYNDFTTTQATLGNLLTRMNTKVASANAVGMTPIQFLAKQLQEKKDGSKAADQIIQRDMETMRSAQNVMRQAQSWRKELGGLNDNLGGSMQLMNTQMNQLAQTNAEMLTYMAQASSDTQIARDAERQKDADATAIVHNDHAANAVARKKATDGMGLTGQQLRNPFQPNQ